MDPLFLYRSIWPFIWNRHAQLKVGHLPEISMGQFLRWPFLLSNFLFVYQCIYASHISWQSQSAVVNWHGMYCSYLAIHACFELKFVATQILWKFNKVWRHLQNTSFDSLGAAVSFSELAWLLCVWLPSTVSRCCVSQKWYSCSNYSKSWTVVSFTGF